MKAILIEPFLVVIVSLFWIIVLPFAALICSGAALSERVESYKARIVAGWREQFGLRPGSRPSAIV
jgi:hypothetical protein